MHDAQLSPDGLREIRFPPLVALEPLDRRLSQKLPAGPAKQFLGRRIDVARDAPPNEQDDTRRNQIKASRIPTERPHERRPEEQTSELQSLMRNSYAVYCLKKKNKTNKQ